MIPVSHVFFLRYWFFKVELVINSTEFESKRWFACLRSQGEGVAYRGRVLVELETKLGPSSKEPSEDLQSHEIIRVQVKRKKGLYLFRHGLWLENEMIDDTTQQNPNPDYSKSYSSQGPLTIHLKHNKSTRNLTVDPCSYALYEFSCPCCFWRIASVWLPISSSNCWSI